jgi:hypothetical protein
MKLKCHQFIHKTLDECVAKIKSYAKYQELKFNQDLVKEIADHINDKIDENEKQIKSSKIDRAKILLDAFQEAFDFNEDEMDILTGIVQFMIDRKLINHFTLSKKTVNAVKKAIRFLSKIYKVIA